MKFLQTTAIVAAGLFALAGCGPKAVQTQIPNYKLMTISLGDREMTSSYSSSIEGKQDIAIYPQISGFITEVCVEEGQKVKKGQTLFIIDQVPYKAALKTAEANVKVAESSLATAELTYSSKQELYKRNVVSEYDLRTAENAYLSAKAQLAQMEAQKVNAENNLSYTVVKSPSDGVVGTLPYKIGALVSASLPQPLTTVSDNSEMYVYFSMTENQMLQMVRQYGTKEAAIAKMPAVQLRLNDRSIYGHDGKIATISGVLDRSTGSVSVKAVFPNPEGLLISGGSGNVIIPTVRENCIIIPKVATYELQDKFFAYKVVDGIANAVEVKVTPATGQEYIVESGLSVGDVIVAEGAGLLRNGTRVQAAAPASANADGENGGQAAEQPAEE